MPVPSHPKIYHIVHVDRLASIAADGHLWCDAVAIQRSSSGTVIGMQDLKSRRLRLSLSTYTNLKVGHCVPFYFCPRSIMLYIIAKANHQNLGYRGGQEPIVHLEADLSETVAWAENQGARWAFTLSNAASNYFEDRTGRHNLEQIDWAAVQALQWSASGVRDRKQSEFLLEHCFPLSLVRRVGVLSPSLVHRVSQALGTSGHRPVIEIKRDWYY